MSHLVNAVNPFDIAVAGEKIMAIGTTGKKDQSDPFQIHFTSATVFPGLINSHDHLDFNCFSILGQRKYTNLLRMGITYSQII